MIAARKNHFGRVNALVKAGANTKVLNENHRAAINFARDFKIVKYLLDNGADPLNRDKWQQTTIFGQKDIAVIELLLSKGVKLNDESTDGETVLFSVTDPKVTEYLIKRGIDINHTEKNTWSVMESDVSQIIEGLKFDEDYQDLFIPKFKVLMKHGIDKKHVQNAYKMMRGKEDILEKVAACFKSYLGK